MWRWFGIQAFSKTSNVGIFLPLALHSVAAKNICGFLFDNLDLIDSVGFVQLRPPSPIAPGLGFWHGQRRYCQVISPWSKAMGFSAVPGGITPESRRRSLHPIGEKPALARCGSALPASGAGRLGTGC